jgi:NTE family protein
MLGPGADDLRAIGVNLMDPSRRDAVLETSLRTSRAALEDALRGPDGDFAATG